MVLTFLLLTLKGPLIMQCKQFIDLGLKRFRKDLRICLFLILKHWRCRLIPVEGCLFRVKLLERKLSPLQEIIIWNYWPLAEKLWLQEGTWSWPKGMRFIVTFPVLLEASESQFRSITSKEDLITFHSNKKIFDQMSTNYLLFYSNLFG